LPTWLIDDTLAADAIHACRLVDCAPTLVTGVVLGALDVVDVGGGVELRFTTTVFDGTVCEGPDGGVATSVAVFVYCGTSALVSTC
jgi:hypothetical protein